MELDTIQVARKIEGCIKSLEKLCAELDGIGDEKVNAEVEYDKEYEIALTLLNSEGVPVTTQRKKAEGILARNGVKERLGLADIRYKALHTKIDAAKSALNGWQSYNRHLSTTVL